jgi:heavy metal sensor kinase
MLSIRWRLALWNTLALAVVLLGFSTLVYGLLARALYQQFDRSLMTELQELENDPRLADDPAARLHHWIGELKEQENIFCIVYDAAGTVTDHTRDLPPESAPPAPPLAPGDHRFGEAMVPLVGRQRTLSSRLRLGGQEYTVLLLAPLEEVDRELGRFLSVLGLAVPLALAVSGGLGYLLARKALAPLDQLHHLTEEITADRLDRRLPVANSRDELGRLTQTINAMIARLERSFAEIRRFTADASHELRTPLTAIRTEAEVALSRPLSPADYQQLLGSILEEWERLTRLTDQLLALSREDAGIARPIRELVDLSAQVEGAVETMRPLAEAKKLGLHAESRETIKIHGDGARLREVFYNLLDNAIKYTPEGGSIAVVLRRQGPTAVITVHDTGIGIPAEHLPRVFDRFYRVDKARSREEGGTGLGLSIAKAIVTAHGGQIELASVLNQGTTCTVTLPEVPQEEPG